MDISVDLILSAALLEKTENRQTERAKDKPFR
jgi:hypothetical protein